MKEAIILAGGLGTRLRSVVHEVPKVMAPVAGKPFLHYIIQNLLQQGIQRIVLAVGYKYEVIETFIHAASYHAEIVWSIEYTPLGTGGGIKQALEKCQTKNVFIVNGDSFFDCDLNLLMAHHLKHGADISLAIKPMKNFDRYGTVTLQSERIVAFNEKQYCDEGLINAGVYIIKQSLLHNLELPDIFSIEKEVFEPYTTHLKIIGFVSDSYFIDIGIPEDYARVQEDKKFLERK